METSFITSIGVFLTFFATCYNAYVLRKNIKTTKYIETISAERIKWLEIIKRETSETISIITETLVFYNGDIENRQSQTPNDVSHEFEYHKYFLDSPTKDAFRFYVKKDFKDLISKLYILKLRINHEENTETIKLIDYFINFYIDILYVSDKNIEEAKENIKKLINNTQKSIDNEWEKVKKETRKI